MNTGVEMMAQRDAIGAMVLPSPTGSEPSQLKMMVFGALNCACIGLTGGFNTTSGASVVELNDTYAGVGSSSPSLSTARRKNECQRSKFVWRITTGSAGGRGSWRKASADV